MELETTDYGFRFIGIRNVGEKGIYVRGYHFVMPLHQSIAASSNLVSRATGAPNASDHMWVPMDGENCMIYNFTYSFNDEPITEDHWFQIEQGHGKGLEQVLPDFLTVGNRDNDWLIDREAQKTDTFTGIDGINAQDVAIQESMVSSWTVLRTIFYGVTWPSSPPAARCFKRLVQLPMAEAHLVWIPATIG